MSADEQPTASVSTADESLHDCRRMLGVDSSVVEITESLQRLCAPMSPRTHSSSPHTLTLRVHKLALRVLVLFVLRVLVLLFLL